MRTNYLIVTASLVALIAAVLACGSAPPVSTSDESGAPVESGAGPADTPIPAAQAVVRLGIPETDPCKLLTKERAESALGQSVGDAIVAQDATVTSCTYLAGAGGEKFATVAIYTGDSAKNHLMNEIAQLQNGCQFSLGTAADQPTPFPAEVESLRAKSIEDLWVQDLGLQQSCGLGPYSQMADLGENAYEGFAFVQGALIGVADENALATFLIADSGASKEEALSSAKELVKLALAR
jgi:hypothetical protein